MRQVRGICRSPAIHWVFDGFPVRSTAPHAVQGEHVSPIPLPDRAGPAQFAPAERPRVVLVLGGEPIDEPVAVHGPFVMNTHAELCQAMAEFQSGRFGRIPA